MSKPITPSEAKKLKVVSIPSEVIDAFNELIVKGLNGRYSTVSQDEVIALVRSKMRIQSDCIFNSHWLDVESIYIQAGWKVEYNKPGFNESYAATFKFTAPATRGGE